MLKGDVLFVSGSLRSGSQSRPCSLALTLSHPPEEEPNVNGPGNKQQSDVQALP